MKRVRGNPITGSTPRMGKNKRPLIPTANQPSRDAQRMIMSAPAPFQNKNTPPNIPAPPNAGFRSKQPYGQAGPVRPRNASAAENITRFAAGSPRTTPNMLSAVGEPRLPRGYNSVNNWQGTPLPRINRGGVQALHGGPPNTRPGQQSPMQRQLARETARLKKAGLGPGIFGS